MSLLQKKSNLKNDKKKTGSGSVPVTVAGDYDVVLHIGTPKTGTSALQFFLLNNREALERAGFYYPEHGMDENKVSGGHSALGLSLVAGRFTEAQKYFQEWLQEAQKRNLSLLLSSEALCSKPVMVRELTKGLRVKVVAYFRSPIASHVSRYNQLVKRHLYTNTLRCYAKNQLCLDSPEISGEIFDEWMEYFGEQNVQVLFFERNVLPRQRVELSFLVSLGVPERQYRLYDLTLGPVNSSYTPAAIELKRLFNLVLDLDNPGMNNRIDVLLQRFSDHSAESKPSTFELLGEELYSELVEKFRLSNERMQTRILYNAPLSSPIDSYPTTQPLPQQRKPEISLKQVLFEVFEENADVREYLCGLVLQRLSNNGFYPYELMKLAELLDIEFQQIDFDRDVFPPNRLSRILSDKAQTPDFLREIALILESCGKIDLAYTVIQRALEMRPKGKGIIANCQRLKEKVEQKS